MARDGPLLSALMFRVIPLQPAVPRPRDCSPLRLPAGAVSDSSLVSLERWLQGCGSRGPSRMLPSCAPRASRVGQSAGAVEISSVSVVVTCSSLPS